MLYSIIIVSLIFLSTFIFLPKFKDFTDRYSISINYVLTLVATLVGVLLAISVTNHEADIREKQDVVKLIRSSISSVEKCYEYTEALIEYFDKIPQEDELKSQFYLKNQPPYPEYLNAFLMQNIVSKNISGASLSELNEQVINLNRSQNNDATIYLSVLDKTRKILSLEILFQKDEINEIQLEEMLSEL